MNPIVINLVTNKCVRTLGKVSHIVSSIARYFNNALDSKLLEIVAIIIISMLSDICITQVCIKLFEDELLTPCRHQKFLNINFLG